MSTDRPLKRKLSRERNDDETRPKQQKFDDDDQYVRNLKLIKAVKKRDESKVKNLLNNGNINIDFQDANIGSFSALHFAVKNENVEIIKLLINNGANPNIQNANGEIPKDLTDNDEILQLLSGDIPICEDDEKGVAEVEKDDSWQKALPPPKTKGGNMKSFLHGITYQQKMLLLTLLTGKKHSHDFCMSTEMGDAEKFDDIVYIRHDKNDFDADGEKKIKFHFFQAKHSQEDDDTSVVETKQKNDICYKDLISKNPKSNYGLLKYFKSFRLINKRFSPFTVEDFVICTNIGLSNELQDSHNIKIVSISETFFTEDFERFMIQPDPSSELYKILEETSDMWILASTLIDHFQNNKPLKLNEFIFSLYHILLFKYGILMHSDSSPNTKNAEDEPKHAAIFNPEFLKNKVNNENAKAFYEVCLNVLGNDKEELLAFENKKLERSKPFGQFHERYFNDLTKNECDAFSRELSAIIRESNGNMVLQYHRSKYGKSNETKGFIEKLAYHVLFYGSDKETVHFGKSFFDDKSPQMLYDSIKKELKEDFDNLKNYKIKISDYHTCYENMKPLTSFEEDKGNLPSEISEFFKSLVFLKTPSDQILIDTIGKVFQNIHNLSDVSFPRCYMNDVIITWMNKKAGGYLNNSSLNNIINEIKGKIKVLEFVGANSKYSVMLDNHVISFEDHNPENTKAEVQRFLRSSDKALFLKTNYYIFGAIKTRNAIIEMEKHKNSDTFIISDAKYLLDKKVKENLKLVLQSKLNLLVIVCEDEEDFQNFDFNNILENPKTQLIVVFSNENENIVNCIIDKTEFQQLTLDSQQTLLNKTITFQGNENIALKELVENNVEIIDSETLTFLAQQKKTNLISIGKPVDTFPGYNEKFYFPRSMERCDLFEKEILKKGSENDLFVIEIDGENNMDFINEKTVKELIQKNDIIINNNEKAEKAVHSNKHYFTLLQDKLIWKRTEGSISVIYEQVRGSSLIDDESATVHKLLHEKTMVISDVAGMGKSTFLTSMTKAIKNKNSNIWVIRVYLNKIPKMLKKNCSLDSITNQFLLRSTSAEKKLFDHYLKDGKNKVLFIMDGYDEVDQNLLDNLDELLKELQTKAMLCITTRIHHEHRLEKMLNTLSYSLTKIEKPTEFLIRFWSDTEAFVSQSSDMEAYAAKIIKDFCSSISTSQERVYNLEFKKSLIKNVDYTFVDIPLHLKMLAEIFGDQQDQDCISISEANNVSAEFDLYELYNKFVYKKLGVYSRDKEKELFDIFDHHEILALRKLLSEKTFNDLFPNINISTAKSDAKIINIGIIRRNNEFLHMTYADFFAAKHLMSNIKNSFVSVAKCINEILEKRSTVFQNFLTQRLEKEERTALLKYGVQNKLFYLVHALIPNYYNSAYIDADNKTPLHYAAESGDIKMVIYLLCHATAVIMSKDGIHQIMKDEKAYLYLIEHGKNLNKTPVLKDLLDYTEIKDKNEKTASDFAATNSNIAKFLKAIEKICDKRYKYKTPDNKKIQWNKEFADPDPQIYNLAYNKLLSKIVLDETEHLTRIFLENIQDKKIRENVFLSSATKQTILDKIFNKRSTLISQKKRNLSKYFQIKLINFLLKNNGIYSNEAASKNDPPMVIVIKGSITFRNCKVFKYYFKKEKKENYIKYFRYACEKKSYEVIEYLLLKHKKILLQSGYPLLNGVFSNFLDTYFILSNFQGDVGDLNTENEEGHTPLISAINNHYNLDSIKFLCDKGVNVNKASKNRNTPLTYAMLHGHGEIIKYLIIDKKAERTTDDDETLFNYFTNPKTFNLDGSSAPLLHQALKNNNMALTKILLQEGVNVNEKDENGVLPFDLAVKHYELARLLLSYGAIFNAKEYSTVETDQKTVRLIEKLHELFENPETLEEGELYMEDVLKERDKLLLNLKRDEDGIPCISDVTKELNETRKNPEKLQSGRYEMSYYINAKNQKGQTLLHIAIEKEIEKEKIEKEKEKEKEKIEKEKKEIKEKEEKEIEKLIKLIKKIEKEKAVYKICQHISYLQRLQKYQSNFYQDCRERTLNEKDNNGNCPLHIFVKSDDKETKTRALYLLGNGANFEKPNGVNKLPIEITNNGSIESCLFFLSGLFHYKCYHSNCEKWLQLEFCHLFNAKDSKGNTLLHYIIHSEFIRKLSKTKLINFNALNSQNQTALEVAIVNKDLIRARHLILGGATYTSKHHYLLNKLYPSSANDYPFLVNEFKKKIHYELHAESLPDTFEQDFERKATWDMFCKNIIEINNIYSL